MNESSIKTSIYIWKSKLKMNLDHRTIQEEVKKCGTDVSYFLKNYVYISHPNKGLIPFSIYKYQDKLLHDFNDFRFNIILKSRQLGISTIVARVFCMVNVI